MCFCYVLPENSGFLKLSGKYIFQDVEVEISLHKSSGNVILCGGFVLDQNDQHFPVIDIPSYDKDVPIFRRNRDKHLVDKHGKKILDICKSSGLRILNGRTRGDREGSFTRIPIKINDKPSTIDYAIVCQETSKYVREFFVLPSLGLSDHNCLLFFTEMSFPRGAY